MTDDNKLTTISVREDTLTKVKLIAAVRSRPQYEILADIIDAAFLKISKEEGRPWFEPSKQK